MGNYAAHVWTIIITIITLIMSLLIWAYGFMDLDTTLFADNLQDAVRTALYASQDRADRTERGSFVINKKIFKDVLGSTSVKQIGGKTLNSTDKTRIYYLPDYAGTDRYNNTDNPSNGFDLDHADGYTAAGQHDDQSNLANDHNVSTGSGYKEGRYGKKPWISNHDTSDGQTDTRSVKFGHVLAENLTRNDDAYSSSHDTLGNNNSNDYETVRGVRVVVDTGLPKFDGGNNNDTLRNKLKNEVKDNQLTQFTATDIIQTYAKNQNNDTYNDLTR